MSRSEREEYEDWDEYEDTDQEEGGRGGDEYEEEEEEEEEEEALPQPTQQELEYLELRKQLKDSFRKQMKKENGSSLGHSQERKKKLPYDNYGSFFGPSQPVIAQRVIQESKSLLENERLTAKIPQHNNHSNKASVSTSSNTGSKNYVHVSRPKSVNQVKNKVEKAKVARDYSFLFSDDAELPAPTKVPPRKSSDGHSYDARSAQVPPKNKQLFNSNNRQVQNGSRQVQNGSRQVQNGSRQQVQNGSRQQVQNGSRQQVQNGSRQVSEKNKQISNGREEKNVSSAANGHHRGVSSSANTHHRVAPQKSNSASKPISKPVDSRKQILNNNGSGPGRPLASKPLSTKAPSGTIQKKLPLSGVKSNNLQNNLPKPSSTKLQSSALKKPMISKPSSAPKQALDQRKGYQDPSKGKILSKCSVSSSRPQINKPSTKVPSRPDFQKDRPKKRPARPFSDDEDDLDGGADVSSMIQKLMGYNPNKYKGRDLDDSDMEANFDEILREEDRSARIAKEEDEEEFRKIEEEERRERLRKEAKKRKLSHR